MSGSSLTRHPRSAITANPVTDPQARADAITATALLNCLRREIANIGGRSVADGTYVQIELPCTATRLRARCGRWAEEPERHTDAGWQPMTWLELAQTVHRELARHTGGAGTGFIAEIADSHRAIAAILGARDGVAPPADLYQRSEQALVAGHRYHPAPKGRGGIAAERWLPYAPEAHAAFVPGLLAVRDDVLVDDGDTAAFDALAPGAPDGYRLLPAHPWQLDLLQERLRDLPALHDGRLRVLGPPDRPVWPTSSVRTVYDPAADVFYKFSLDVQITNDVRRLWRHDLRWITPLVRLLQPAFAEVCAAVPGAAFLVDRGYRTIEVGDDDVYEGLAAVVRDGVRTHAWPGVTPLLAAGISEGFRGNPLDGQDADTALEWWRRYLAIVVRPVLHLFFRHGVVLECHLQNVLVGVDRDAMPVQAFFRDHEGLRLLGCRHAELLQEVDGDAHGRGVDREYGWQRLQYCLITNHLHEIAGAVVHRHPDLAAEVWAQARAAFTAYGTDYGAPPELSALLAATHVPSKTNLLLRWTRADGAASTYAAYPNPLRTAAAASQR